MPGFLAGLRPPVKSRTITGRPLLRSDANFLLRPERTNHGVQQKASSHHKREVHATSPAHSPRDLSRWQTPLLERRKPRTRRPQGNTPEYRSLPATSTARQRRTASNAPTSSHSTNHYKNTSTTPADSPFRCSRKIDYPTATRNTHPHHARAQCLTAHPLTSRPAQY